MQAILSYFGVPLQSVGTAAIVWAARTDCPACVCKPSVTCGGGAPPVVSEASWIESTLCASVLLAVFAAGLVLGAAAQVVFGARAARQATPLAAAAEEQLAVEAEARLQAAAARARTQAAKHL